MRFLMNVVHDSTEPATEDEMAAIDAFNVVIEASGQRVMAAGLAAPSNSAVVDARGARSSVTHGPAVEADDFVVGFWVIDAPDKDAAMLLAAEASQACHRRIELRAFL
ncbi:YciI family protein [Demequina rhizosphaerae]|uniref:YciI family protein n=1 Tax=Demequina rhizosphaerae TaxID=1638985 RepID=UPI0007861578|nr:YciI family protein [Demequina rhizosphaerae]